MRFLVAIQSSMCLTSTSGQNTNRNVPVMYVIIIIFMIKCSESKTVKTDHYIAARYTEMTLEGLKI